MRLPEPRIIDLERYRARIVELKAQGSWKCGCPTKEAEVIINATGGCNNGANVYTLEYFLVPSYETR